MNILISLLLISFVSTIDIDHTLAKSHKQGNNEINFFKLKLIPNLKTL